MEETHYGITKLSMANSRSILCTYDEIADLIRSGELEREEHVHVTVRGCDPETGKFSVRSGPNLLEIYGDGLIYPRGYC